MSDFMPKYTDGAIMRVGDRVCRHYNDYGTLVQILTPGTREASDYGMPGGGVLVEYDSFGLAVDEPTEFQKVDSPPPNDQVPARETVRPRTYWQTRVSLLVAGTTLTFPLVEIFFNANPFFAQWPFMSLGAILLGAWGVARCLWNHGRHGRVWIAVLACVLGMLSLYMFATAGGSFLTSPATTGGQDGLGPLQ